MTVTQKVMLNLFQHPDKQILKQVQNDSNKLRMTETSSDQTSE